MRDGKAQKVPINTGFDDGINVEITGGLAPNDAVILTGKQAVTAKMKSSRFVSAVALLMAVNLLARAAGEAPNRYMISAVSVSRKPQEKQHAEFRARE